MLQSLGSQRVGHNWAVSLHFMLSLITRTQPTNPEKAMAPHSSTLAWKIPWMKEPGRLQSMGSLKVRHDWATSLSLFTFMHWRRKWQPTPVFLPGESQGRGGILVGWMSMGSHRVGHDWSDSAVSASVLLSQLVPPSFPHCVHKSVFYVHRQSCKA